MEQKQEQESSSNNKPKEFGGSFLTDTDLKKILCSDKKWENREETLRIYPYEETCMTPTGYDLRVGYSYISMLDAERYFTTEKIKEQITQYRPVEIRPGDTVAIRTYESIDMPEKHNLSALITSKVSLLAKGLSPVSTNIDADWCGILLIILHNPTQKTITLNYKDPFCTINFFLNASGNTKKSRKYDCRSDVELDIIVANKPEANKVEKIVLNSAIEMKKEEKQEERKKEQKEKQEKNKFRWIVIGSSVTVLFLSSTALHSFLSMTIFDAIKTTFFFLSLIIAYLAYLK